MCGHSYGKHGKLTESDCSLDCFGDNDYACGSSWVNSVWSTGFGGSDGK